MSSLVAINGASLPQRITGVQRYARELTSRLLLEPGVRLLISDELSDYQAPEAASVEVRPTPKWIKRAGAYGWANTSLRSALQRGEVLWSPTVRAPIAVSPHVVTVHDFSVLDHPEWFTRKVISQWRTMVTAIGRAATHVVTDSGFSRDRAIELWRLDPARVSVVPCGVDRRFTGANQDDAARVRERLSLPKRFALSVASVDPRKNLEPLISAWGEFYEDSGLHLVLAGGESRTFARGQRETDVPGVLRLGYVAEADLPGLYAAANVFAFPSVYEGFGLPPLEAMAAGTPVVGSALTPAVAEVVGTAGLLVHDPDPRAFALAVHDLGLGGEAAQRLRELGRERAATYDWDSSAAVLLRTLRDPYGIHLG